MQVIHLHPGDRDRGICPCGRWTGIRVPSVSIQSISTADIDTISLRSRLRSEDSRRDDSFGIMHRRRKVERWERVDLVEINLQFGAKTGSSSVSRV